MLISRSLAIETWIIVCLDIQLHCMYILDRAVAVMVMVAIHNQMMVEQRGVWLLNQPSS